jgi:EAL domain-containing protein (putative c-di-GMP-specific phosphodiesterase class I)
MKIIKSFTQYIKESFEADVALENLFFEIYGDKFLDNRSAILDDIYSTLSAKTVNFAYDDLCNDYPELSNYKKEFYAAAEKEGYFVMNDQKWEDSDFN